MLGSLTDVCSTMRPLGCMADEHGMCSIGASQLLHQQSLQPCEHASKGAGLLAPLLLAVSAALYSQPL